MRVPLTTFGVKGIGFLFQSGVVSSVSGGAVEPFSTATSDSDVLSPIYQTHTLTGVEGTGTESSQSSSIPQYIEPETIGGTLGIVTVETFDTFLGIHRYIPSKHLLSPTVTSEFEDLGNNQYVSSVNILVPPIVTTGFVDGSPSPIYFASNGDFTSIPILTELVESQSDMYFSGALPIYIDQVPEVDEVAENESEVLSPSYFSSEELVVHDIIENNSQVFIPQFFVPASFFAPLVTSQSDRWTPDGPAISTPGGPFGNPPNPGLISPIITAEYRSMGRFEQKGFIFSQSQVFSAIFDQQQILAPFIASQSQIISAAGFPEYNTESSAIASASPFAWYKAEDLVLADGADVASWNDSSLNSHHLTSNGNQTYRANQINGFPAVEFAPTSYMTTGGNGILCVHHDFSVFIVVKKKDSANGGLQVRWFGSTDANYYAGNIYGAGTVFATFGNSTDSSFSIPQMSAVTSNQFAILSARKRSGQHLPEMYIDGVSQSVVDGGGSGTSAYQGTTRELRLTCFTDTVWHAEVVFFDKELSNQKVSDIHDELKNKYGIV